MVSIIIFYSYLGGLLKGIIVFYSKVVYCNNTIVGVYSRRLNVSRQLMAPKVQIVTGTCWEVLPNHHHEPPNHHHELPSHHHQLPNHHHVLPNHHHELPNHHHELPIHDHELPYHHHEQGLLVVDDNPRAKLKVQMLFKMPWWVLGGV